MILIFLVSYLLAIIPGWWLGTRLLSRGWTKWQVRLLFVPGFAMWLLGMSLIQGEAEGWVEYLFFTVNTFASFLLIMAANMTMRWSWTGEELDPPFAFKRRPRAKRERAQSKLSAAEQREILVETIEHGLQLSVDEAKSFSVIISLADHDPALRDPRAMSSRSLMQVRLMADDYFARYASGFPDFNGKPWPEARRHLESCMRRLK